MLGQRNVFRFDDFEDVGIVQDEILQSLPRDFQPNRKAVWQDARVEVGAIPHVQDFGLVELCELPDGSLAFDLDVVPLVVRTGPPLRPFILLGRPLGVSRALASHRTRRNFLRAGTGDANVNDVELVFVDVAPRSYQLVGKDAAQPVCLVGIVEQRVDLGDGRRAVHGDSKSPGHVAERRQLNVLRRHNHIAVFLFRHDLEFEFGAQRV